MLGAMADGRAVGDPYQTLEVAPGAEPEVVDAAYRALARKYHPDVNRSPGAAERMREINAAYAVLRDPARRAALDGNPAAPERRVSTRPAAQPRAGQAERPFGTPSRPASPGDAGKAATAPGVAGQSGLVRQAVGRVWAEWRRLGARDGRQFALGAAVVLLLAGAVAGGLLAWRARTAATALPAYWRTAASARTAVDASRQRLQVLAGGGYEAAAGNPAFVAAAGQLAQELHDAQQTLRGVPGTVPPAAVAFHYAQLADWEEERRVREAQRDAAATRNPALWAEAAAQEAAWRGGTRHQQVESLARELAAAVGR